MKDQLGSSSGDVEEWVDHTNASPFEEFVAAIEHELIEWNLNDTTSAAPQRWTSEQQHVVRSANLKFKGTHQVILRWCIRNTNAQELMSNAEYPTATAPEFVKWFGVSSFILLTPSEFGRDSYSYLDPSIATTLRSALSLALGNAKCSLPGFVPIMEKNRLCFLGCAMQGRNHGGSALRFHVDCKSKVPQSLTSLEGLERLFRGKLLNTYSNLSIFVRHTWTAMEFEEPVLSPNRFSADDMGWAKWSDHDVSWRMDRRSDLSSPKTSPSPRIFRLQGPSGAPLWGPLEDALRSVTVGAVWPKLDETCLVHSKLKGDTNLLRMFPPSDAPQWDVEVSWGDSVRTSTLDLMRPEELAPMLPVPVLAGTTGRQGKPPSPAPLEDEPAFDQMNPLTSSLRSIVLLYEDALALPRETILCRLHADESGLVDSSFESVNDSPGPSNPAPARRRKRDLLNSARMRDAIAYVMKEAIKSPLQTGLPGFKTQQINDMVQELFSVRMAEGEPQLPGKAPGGPYQDFSVQFEREMLQDLNMAQLTTARREAREDRVKTLSELLDGESKGGLSQRQATNTNASTQTGNTNDGNMHRVPSTLRKVAPAGSLLSVLALRHVSEFGSLADVAGLWNEIVKELRWHWENLVPIPVDVSDRQLQGATLSLENHVPSSEYCLLHQNLQLLNTCILLEHMRMSHTTPYQQGKQIDSVGPDAESVDSVNSDEFFDAASGGEDVDVRMGLPGLMISPQVALGNQGTSRQGDPDSFNHPITRVNALMTETMIEDEQRMANMMGNPGSDEAQETSINERVSHMIKNIVHSDMQAFKAANPKATLKQFNTWVNSSQAPAHCSAWAFERLESNYETSIESLWSECQAVPLYAQKAYTANGFAGEAEKCLHRLETISPRQLLGQLVPIAFNAANFVLQSAETQAMESEAIKSRLDRMSVAVTEIGNFPLLHCDWQEEVALNDASSRTPEQLERLRQSLQVAIREVYLAEDILTKATSLFHKFPYPIAKTIVDVANSSPVDDFGKAQNRMLVSFSKSRDRNAIQQFVWHRMPRVTQFATGVVSQKDTGLSADAGETPPPHETEVLLQADCFRQEIEPDVCVRDAATEMLPGSGHNRMYCCFSGMEFRVGLVTSASMF